MPTSFAFTVAAFFSVTPLLIQTNRVLEFVPNIQNVVTNLSWWQCLCRPTLLFCYFISSYYSTRCWKLSLYHPLY